MFKMCAFGVDTG